jgi:hypothetical protein
VKTWNKQSVPEAVEEMRKHFRAEPVRHTRLNGLSNRIASSTAKPSHLRMLVFLFIKLLLPNFAGGFKGSGRQTAMALGEIQVAFSFRSGASSEQNLRMLYTNPMRRGPAR